VISNEFVIMVIIISRNVRVLRFPLFSNLNESIYLEIN